MNALDENTKSSATVFFTGNGVGRVDYNGNNILHDFNGDIEYYPRLKRAPYLYNVSDFGIRQRRNTHLGSTEIWDATLNDDDGNSCGGILSRTPTKVASSSNLSQHQTPRRRSSLARVFSSLGMSPLPVVEAPGAADDDAAGGLRLGDSETNPNMLIPPQFRRRSSFEISSLKGVTDNMRDRLSSYGSININRYPKWAFYDPSAIVMNEGLPVSIGTLVHHQYLLNHSQVSTHSSQCIITPTWRLKERMKTVGVCLILALNTGTDPPDLNKPTPCAKLQCWLDPTSISRAKAKERIGERLEQQYAKWQQKSKMKYRRAIDPTIDTVKDLCIRMRESVKGERVLLHYNGHGVPRPTVNGEIWLFDKHHTNYIPLSVMDLRRWIGKPSCVILDCSGAGVLMPFFTAQLNEGGDFSTGVAAPPSSVYRGTSTAAMDTCDPSDAINGAECFKAIRDTIVLCPTAQGEWLPLNPEFPADIFTSCLTTPIPIALRWFIHQNPLSMEFIDLETIADMIPGKLTDRKTPLGELNWIFTAVTDTIAWNVLPSCLFQRLFRQDLLVASMFRNFLLADRILRGLNCSPTSNPELPSTCNHPLWQAWDLAVETCLHQLIDHGYLPKKDPGITRGISTSVPPSFDDEGDENLITAIAQEPPTPLVANVTYPVDAPFFAEQLTAFEIWVEYANSKPKSKVIIRCPPTVIGGTPLSYLHRSFGSENTAIVTPYELDPPQELPIVLQVLLSQVHRVRALVLLKRFLDLGPSAVNLALSVGIFPYVLKLLQSPIDEYKHVLIGIWARIMAFDESCQVDVVKDRALPHFIRHLCWGESSDVKRNLTAPSLQSFVDTTARRSKGIFEQRTMAAFILSVICSGYSLGQSECVNEKLHLVCDSLLQSYESQDENERIEVEESASNSAFRVWLCICLGNLVKDNTMAQKELYETGLHIRLISRLNDVSVDVRTASCYALGCLIGSATPKSNFDETVPSWPSMPQHQIFHSPQHAPPSLQPENGTLPVVSLSLNFVSKYAPNTTLSKFDLTSTQQQQNFGLQHSDTQLKFDGSVTVTPQSAPGRVSCLALENDPSLMYDAETQVPLIPTYLSTESSSPSEDDKQIKFDRAVALRLCDMLEDASPTVRCEALLSLSLFIKKYLVNFVFVAGETMGTRGRSAVIETMQSVALRIMNESDQNNAVFEVWSKILKLHRKDPHPSVRSLVNSIFTSVNERVMSEKLRARHLRSDGRRQFMTSSSIENGYHVKNGFNSISTHPVEGSKNTTGVNFAPDNRSPTHINLTGPLGANSFSAGTPPRALQEINNPIHNRKALTPNTLFSLTNFSEFLCLESKFYSWKKVEFADRGIYSNTTLFDPQSEQDIIKKYRFTRNQKMMRRGKHLKDSFTLLANETFSSLDQSPCANWESGRSDAAVDVEDEIDKMKQALHLHQIALLRNNNARGTTSLLCFHPYEPALIVCGGTDNISCWNIQTSERMVSFSNESPKNTLITSAMWINETNTSLLLTGSSDGSVRIWDELFEPNDEISQEKPTLISSFFAAPDIISDNRYSSGLVLEYQPYGGQLIAGGNTKQIRCWDMETEKCRNSFECRSDSSLTTLTTAWKNDFSHGYSGFGPDIIIAGYGNGSLRVFDTRSSNGRLAMNLTDERNGGTKRRLKYSEFDEHSSWIVDVSFTTFGGRYEAISGCVAGRIKFWDLRYSTSIRTVDHKMQMTALANHSNIPMVAIGSPAQFIKMISHDGATQQVIRYHEKISGQRIGPVSCLSFHPQMPYLAAGYADELVSLYAPKDFVF